ncbi:hypothetical protein KIW84_010057 [Lathyrus oleraceus]|uniref:Uncharacterized protein n=1 Tax=Pisum sativum TaxID=3888 RepID=A0A9D4YP40_PEA|nr:hypothetical protein KIW84_010057 [Pisum sativum]
MQALSSSSQVTTDQSGAGMESLPLGTSHATANAESHGYHSIGGRFGRGGGRFGRGGGRFGKTQCQICHKSEHDASICYHRYSNSNALSFSPQIVSFNSSMMTARPMYQPSFGYAAHRPTPPRSPIPQAFLIGSDPNFNNQWWYPDSGASHHFTPDASNLSDSISLPINFDQWAYVLTKPLSAVKFLALSDKLRLFNKQNLIDTPLIDTPSTSKGG